MNESIKVPIGPAAQSPLNYAVPDPNNPATMMPRYPVNPRAGLVPASSAHAYIDYIEGCLAEVQQRLSTLEAAHADLAVAFYRRSTEFESRLDSAQAEIKDLKTLALHLTARDDATHDRISELEGRVSELDRK